MAYVLGPACGFALSFDSGHLHSQEVPQQRHSELLQAQSFVADATLASMLIRRLRL